MSENKFEKKLQGVETAEAVFEIKNSNTPASFGNMPQGSSNSNNVYSDARGNAVSVLKAPDNWQLNSATLVEASDLYGDGRDYTSEFSASGSSDWIDSTITFASAKVFVPFTKWILKLCGHSLFSSSETISFVLTITFSTGETIAKNFNIARQAGNFCKEFIIDFSEGEDNAIKVSTGGTMNIKLTCSDATASATIYNGMSVLSALQRRIDTSAVASDERTLDDIISEVASLEGRGRYLSTWDCTTGLPDTNPPESPYEYKTGDYFVVSTVGATNYRPEGSSYTTGVASTTVETEEVNVNDTYLYDGTSWSLLKNSIDTEYIAHQAMPSDTRTVLTWAASGTTYTMPADGYLVGRRESNNVSQYIFVYNATNNEAIFASWSTANAEGLVFCVPVSKGQQIKISYGDTTDTFLHFYYANGSK